MTSHIPCYCCCCCCGLLLFCADKFLFTLDCVRLAIVIQCTMNVMGRREKGNLF